MLIFLFKLSNVILRHSSFPHTSTFSAFEVSYKNALYKFTVIIITVIVIKIDKRLVTMYLYMHTILFVWFYALSRLQQNKFHRELRAA